MSNAKINKDVAIRYVEELWPDGNLDVADEIISTSPENVRGIKGGTAQGPEGVKAMVGGVRSLREPGELFPTPPQAKKSPSRPCCFQIFKWVDCRRAVV
jgi:hypothetical protein